MKLSRRSVLRATASTLVAPAFGALGAALPERPALAQTQPQVWRHAMSLFGDVKYPEGFKHFEYVNPKAPQGGSVRQSAFGTFDNFNLVVSGVKGSIAAGTELFTETLTTASLDEVSKCRPNTDCSPRPSVTRMIIPTSHTACVPMRAGTMGSRSRPMTFFFHSTL